MQHLEQSMMAVKWSPRSVDSAVDFTHRCHFSLGCHLEQQRLVPVRMTALLKLHSQSASKIHLAGVQYQSDCNSDEVDIIQYVGTDQCFPSHILWPTLCRELWYLNNELYHSFIYFWGALMWEPWISSVSIISRPVYGGYQSVPSDSE